MYMGEKLPHILIFGTGAVGGYIGGRLHIAAQSSGAARVSFYGRERMGQIIKDHGLTLSHFERPAVTVPPEDVDYITQLERAKRPDVIFLCVKSQDTETAAAQIKAQGWACPIVSWQNGVGNVARLGQALPHSEIIPGVVPYNIAFPKPGVFHCGTGGALLMGEAQSGAVKAAAKMMSAGGERVHMTGNIESYQWGKLIINLNNALNTLWGRPLLSGFMQKGYRKAWAASMEEGFKVLAANNIKAGHFNGTDPKQFIKLLRLPTFLFARNFQKQVTVDKTARSSMLDDLEGGKPSEIYFLQGAILDLAKASVMTAPINQAVYDATRAAFAAGESPKMSGKQIWDLVR